MDQLTQNNSSQSDSDTWIKQLAALAVFPDAPIDDLHWFVGQCEYHILNPGEHLVRKGEEARFLVVVLRGTLSLRIHQAGSYQELAQLQAGALTGLLPYSRMTRHTGDVVALDETEVLRFPKAKFDLLIATSRPIVQHLVNSMTDRVKNFTEQQLLNEKLVSLGKLSAGLAHELNNPAAAIARSAAELGRHLSNVAANFKRVASIHLNAEMAHEMEQLIHRLQHRQQPPHRSALQRSRQELELLGWLDDQKIENADEIAQAFVESDWKTDDLESVRACVGTENLNPVLEWLVHVLVTDQNVRDIQESARRINDLVHSVKGFTHMDRSTDAHPLDLHPTLLSTLTMLKHAIKSKSIEVVLEFEEHPVIASVHPGEISQVWTNLIDNAIDAAGEGGQLRIRSRNEREFVQVFIQDNGKGIPPEIQSSIFDPFFTTKEPGKGTGLGLDLAQKIVSKYRGQIRFRSKPGETIFEVCLPRVSTP